MPEPGDSNLFSVGLDVGSQNARIFISNSTTQQPSIVPNEIGQRYSLAISTPEPEIDIDPLNDWKDAKELKKNKGKVSYLFGEAAKKSLQRLKRPLGPHTILNIVQQETNDEEDNSDKMASCEHFFEHLAGLTTNASHTSPQNLRFVLSTPASNPTNEPEHNSSYSKALSNLSSSLEKGVLKCINKAGYKKSEKKEIYAEQRVVAVITNPIAIAHAHKLFDSSHPPSRDVLIVDWGASALSLSHLSITNGFAQVKKHACEQSLSGKNVISLLVQHIAELFERKNRCIPSGETTNNKKARAKLEVAAENALRSFGFSQKVTVTVDGLIEGIDCHVDVMLARFEMLMGNILRNAEGKIKQFGTFDSMIGAGNLMRMKCVEKMVDRLFPSDQCFRGTSLNEVPPEEAIAIGCAIYGSIYLSSSFIDNSDESKEEENDLMLDEDVPLSPFSIGIGIVEGDPAAHIIIPKGVPLPALVTKAVDVTGSPSKSITIIQISEGETTIGRIEGIDTNTEKEIEITMELSAEGSLSVSVNGGSTIKF